MKAIIYIYIYVYTYVYIYEKREIRPYATKVLREFCIICDKGATANKLRHIGKRMGDAMYDDAIFAGSGFSSDSTLDGIKPKPSAQSSNYYMM